MADASVTVPAAGGPRLANPPDALELRHLRAFICVAEELNFSRAADRLFVSQPALSRQIRALERLIGCDLLRRSTHQVELTPGGEALLEPARQLLRDLAAAVGAARSASGELAATLHKRWGTITDLTAADAALRELRGAYEALHAQFALPQGLTVLPVNANGVACLRLAPETEPPATVVYLHGGCNSAGPRSATGTWPARLPWPPIGACSSLSTGWRQSTHSPRRSRMPCVRTFGCLTRTSRRRR